MPLPLRPRTPRPKKAVNRGSVVCLQATEEWRDWYDQLRAHCDLTQAELVAFALQTYGQKQGFHIPMPPR